MNDGDEGGAQNNNKSGSPQQNWRGCCMEEIHRYLNEFELDHLESVRPSEQHTVLHHFPIRNAEDVAPRPLKCHQKWDALHVRLPCSPRSQYPVNAADGTSSIEPRWGMIERALLRPITSSHELQEAILAYNSKYDSQWNFRALHELFDDEMDEDEARLFFEDLLPRIIRLALQLPHLVQAPIPLLKQGKTHSITLTQQQISCLLANAFLCTYPRRNTMKRKSEYSTFPDINFNRLFQSSGKAVLEKIKCICHYFRRVCPTESDNSNVPTGVVTFTRRSLHQNELPDWSESKAPLGVTPLHITSAGTIEDQGLGLLQVDFANKYLGGGVLGSGCVQEEIRFVICPELLISKLFTECLRPTEALLMVGCERYSNYTGYARTFEWAGNHEDNIPRDSSRRRMTHIVAIDALAFVQSQHQYREDLMLRELNKAYVGFLHTLKTAAPGVASGNWGCGAFGGEATLKALLQLMVCTVVQRPLVYYTFGNVELRDEVHRMHTFFIEENMRVCDLWAILKKFHAQHLAGDELYNFIYNYQRNGEKHRPNSKTTSPTLTKNSAQTKKNALTSSTSPISAKATSSEVHAKTTEPMLSIFKSQDLFASSSSDNEETNIKTASTFSKSVADKSCKAIPTSQINFSDDSENDNLLLVAMNEPSSTTLAQTSPKVDSKTKISNIAATTESPNRPKTSKPSRQRTLLEMLDSCYTNDDNSKVRNTVGTNSEAHAHQPASKRHCAHVDERQ